MEKGDFIKLARQTVEIVGCERCSHHMVNIDKKELQIGDLSTLKKARVRISDPDTTDPLCLDCGAETLAGKLIDWWNRPVEDDDDDSSWFTSSGSSSGGSFLGGGSLGGFGGGSSFRGVRRW